MNGTSEGGWAWRGAASLLLLATVVWTLAGAPSISADTSCVGTFSMAPSTIACTVPAHITALHMVAVGGRGATYSSPGGFGAVVTADVVATPGASFWVNVGGNGNDSGVGGANGGGNGGGSFSAGGGGASDIRLGNDSVGSRVLVAGGGGGGGYGSSAFTGADADGGSGGFLLGGTSASGSTPGTGNPSGQDACKGNDGGGTSGGGGGAGYDHGAGGGGGYAGGGGGGEVESGGSTCSASIGGGGGGGSSLVPPGGTRTTDTTGSPSVTITAPVPTTPTGPSISGPALVGQLLTESHAPWANGPTAYTIQWLRCDASGSACLAVGAGNQTYTLTGDDLGHTIEVQETASNVYGSSLANGQPGTVTSAPTPVVGAPPGLINAPAVAGTATVGQTLSEVNAVWSNPPVTARSYQWRRCNRAGASCVAIVGATAQSHRLTPADVGSTISVQETASNSYGASAPASSSATAVVTALPAPRASIVGPATVHLGRSVRYTASVTDQQGGAKTFQWTAGGSHAGTGQTVKHVFSRPGSQVIAVRVLDTAGNTFTARLTVTVKSSELGVRVLWSARSFMQPDFSVFTSLRSPSVPSGTHILLTCAGSGCPFGSRSTIVHGKRSAGAGRRAVDLTPLVAGAHFAAGTRLRVVYKKRFWIASRFTFTVGADQPHETIDCIAPGSRKPRRC